MTTNVIVIGWRRGGLGIVIGMVCGVVWGRLWDVVMVVAGGVGGCNGCTTGMIIREEIRMVLRLFALCKHAGRSSTSGVDDRFSEAFDPGEFFAVSS